MLSAIVSIARATQPTRLFFDVDRRPIRNYTGWHISILGPVLAPGRGPGWSIQNVSKIRFLFSMALFILFN